MLTCEIKRRCVCGRFRADIWRGMGRRNGEREGLYSAGVRVKFRVGGGNEGA